MTLSTPVPPYALSLLPIRRIVTGHTPDGMATVIRDERLTPVPDVPNVPDSGRITRIWTTKQSPVVHSDETVDGGTGGPDRLGLVSTNGTNIGSFDVAPGNGVPRHRTSTIDYIILISGELTAVLEDGTERTLSEPGTILVQRGTLHKWENRGPGWVRFLAVLVDAKPVEIVDKEGKTEVLKEGFA
ncbi:hypothetical protein BS47DRAFT_1001441 [Hydnum rufescens UP504]|uniref:Cupin type-2 domain-containing protein n=1 Tax=Hydnum rufescens UP504 TaxID=1448309 RepID=A0A9P6B8S2_9AGAM|nr:hypothetical protein BS47DRAFT_1001441 [Hydnum rufescens UP504]